MNNRPFLLTPAGKDYLWGGNRLKFDMGKNLDLEPLAETWECSTHPEGPSVVASGEHCGKTLKQVLKDNPEYMGTHPEHFEGLPILIKMIDAKSDLSVQVHPTDEYASINENGQKGKTELWYVMDAAKGARLVYGLKRDITRQAALEALNDGTFSKYLQSVPVKRGDLFFVEAGTIHAIGAGALIAEIQENSNLTYRLFDYNRVDKDGNRRELHVEKALEVARLEKSPEPRQPLRVLKYTPGVASELLCRCRYFEVYRMLINTQLRQKVYYESDSLSFRVLLCMSGCGTISFEDEALNFYKGDCIFVPASSVPILLHGRADFLDVRC